MKSVGKATRPHGLKGGVIFQAWSGCGEEFLKRALKPGSVVYLSLLEEGGREREIALERIIFSKKILVYFQGYSDRSAVEKLLPFELMVEDSSEDLKGFAVYSQESGEEVGKIASIGSNGVQKILEIRGKENFDIPWIPEFVKRVDKMEKKVFVYVPEYEEA